jgi:membrane protease YdiL (CAAX protease family)
VSVTVVLLTLFFLLTRLFTQTLVGERALGRTLAQYPRYLVTVLALGVLLPLLGEELGWRGFLFPRLAQQNIHLALIGTMVAWWLFHGPLGFLAPTLRDVPRWIPLNGLLGIAGPSFFAGWLLLQTGSLWPSVIFHLTWNLLNPAVFGNLYTAKEGLLRGPIWLINGEGVMGMVVSTVAIAPIFYYLALRAAQN